MQFKLAGQFILNKLRNELPKHLSYHSVEHVKDVYQAAMRLGKMEGVSRYELKLLLTAACYHDSGFLKGAVGHEEESCRMVKEVLPGYGYNEQEVNQICGMIMATKIPQTPLNHLEEILADSDLEYLGREDFFTIGNKLFTELRVFGLINTEDEWNRLQVRFLEKHHFFTKTAIALLKNKKEEHLEQIRLKLI